MTRRQLTLHLLRQAGDTGVTTSQLLQAGCGSRYGARILELREQGHVIESRRIRDGAFLYTLTFDVERDTGKPRSLESEFGAEPAGVALSANTPPPALAGDKTDAPSLVLSPATLFDPEPTVGLYDPDADRRVA